MLALLIALLIALLVALVIDQLHAATGLRLHV